MGIGGLNLCAADGRAVDSVQVDIYDVRGFTSEIFIDSQRFGKDISRVEDVPVNRTFEPKLYSLYVKSFE